MGFKIGLDLTNFVFERGDNGQKIDYTDCNIPSDIWLTCILAKDVLVRAEWAWRFHTLKGPNQRPSHPT